MKKRTSQESEAEELRKLIAEEKRRIDALEDMIGAPVADAVAYREAFKRFLELLPESSRLMVTSSVPKNKMH